MQDQGSEWMNQLAKLHQTSSVHGIQPQHIPSTPLGRLAIIRVGAERLIQYANQFTGSPYDRSLRACSRAVMLGSKFDPGVAAWWKV